MSGGLLYVEVAPYWNVNSSAEIVDMRVAAVEVAPYWNVNRDVSSSQTGSIQ